MSREQLIGGVVPLLDGPDSEALIGRIARAGWSLVVFDGASARNAALPRLASLAHRLGLRVIVRTEDPHDPALAAADAIVPPADELLLEDGTAVRCLDVDAVLQARLVELAGARPQPTREAPVEPLVLLSGMLGDHTLWEEVIPAMPGVTDVRCARIDLDDSVTEMARSVLAVAPERFALAGHSLGAIVALDVGRQAPHRVTRLALLNASGRPASPAQQALWSASTRRVENGGFDGVADELAAATLPPSKRADADLVNRNRKMAGTVTAEGTLRQFRAQHTRPDSLTTAAVMTVPALVVGGDLDDVCPLERQRELVAALPSAALVVIEGAGHMLPLEAPHEVAAVLLRWLAADAR